MISKREVFKNFKLYAVSQVQGFDSGFFKKAEEIYRGGADIVQLRSKVLTDHELIRLGNGIRKIANQYHKLYFVNDRVDVALATQADGIHVGQEDFPIAVVQSLIRKSGDNLFVGKSTHSVEQAQTALSEDLDYIGVGPVFSTPTKPHYPAVGLDLVSEVSRFAKKPFVAIGGIDTHNMEQVLTAGATRVAVVRAVFEPKESYHATRRLCEILREFKPQNV